MHTKSLSLVGLSAASLAATVLLASPTTAQSPSGVHVGTPSGHTIAPHAKACYSNLGSETGSGYYSTKTKNPPTYTSAGAADVVLAKPCKVKTIQANGVIIPGSAVDAVTIYVYDDKGGLPGKLIHKAATTGDFGNGGNFSLTVKKPFTIPAGTHWVSVQAKGEYNTNGWYWESTSTVQNGTDVWQNSGGAFSHCTDWATLTTCFGNNYDYLLQLN